ncbi:MAG: hypothetical protein ACRC62_39650 [Microcoleus sp.]
MTQSSILELAKQGDATAIASLMNGQLKPKQINAKVAVKNGCLQVMLEAAEVPERQVLVPWVVKSMAGLGAQSIAAVKIYGRETNVKVPAWRDELELAGQALPLVDATAESIFNLDWEAKPSLRIMQELAKNGDVKALVWLLNLPLKKKGVVATASFKLDDDLEIVLESKQIPDRQANIQMIRMTLMNLKASWIKSVRIYGHKSGEDNPAWTGKFELGVRDRQKELEKITDEQAKKITVNALIIPFYIIIRLLYNTLVLRYIPFFF